MAVRSAKIVNNKKKPEKTKQKKTDAAVFHLSNKAGPNILRIRLNSLLY